MFLPSLPRRTRPRGGSSSNWLSRQAADPFTALRDAGGYRARSAFKLQEMDAAHRLLRRNDTVIDLGAAPGGWTQYAVERVCGGAAPCAPPPALDLLAPAAAGAAAAAGAPLPLAALAAAEAGVPMSPSPVAPPPAPPVAAPGATATPAAPAAARARRPPLVLALDVLPMAPLPGAQLVRADFLRPSTRPALLLARLLPLRGADVVLSDMAHSFTGSASTDHTRQMALAWAALLFACDALAAGGTWVCKVRQGEEYGALRAAARARFGVLREVKPAASRADSAEAYLIGRGFLAAGGEGAPPPPPWPAAAAQRLREHGLLAA
jgi:23S rRNA U2552 (ribose-2'-O)-methylase RlmE/FtsJ